MKEAVRRFCSILFLALLLGASVGCASVDDNDTSSARPWNSPKGWEHGLPTGMMPGGR